MPRRFSIQRPSGGVLTACPSIPILLFLTPQGGTCGFGMRGQKARSGRGTRPGFEGGQTPMHRRFPKLKGIAGGMGAGRAKYVTVNVDDISAAFAANKLAAGSEVSIEEGDARMFVLSPGVSLQELVDAVNQVGAAPGDVIAVLEALQQAGAMSAQLIVI